MTQLSTRTQNAVWQRSRRGHFSSGWIDVRLEVLERRFVLSANVAAQSLVLAPSTDSAIVIDAGQPAVNLGTQALATGNQPATVLTDGAFGGVVGRFKGPLSADQYVASINWGDGSTSPGQISQDADGTIVVSGIHQYTDAHHHFVITSLHAVDGSEPNGFMALGAAKDIITSADPMLIDWAEVRETRSRTHLFLGGLYDVEPRQASDYILGIDWGDGTTSQGEVVAMDGGGFALYGDHAYPDSTHARLTLTVTRNDRETITRMATIRVYSDTTHYFLNGSELKEFYYEAEPDPAQEVVTLGSDKSTPMIDRRVFPAPAVETPTAATNQRLAASAVFELALSTSDKDPLFGDRADSSASNLV
jgi:hypothetical protein